MQGRGGEGGFTCELQAVAGEGSLIPAADVSLCARFLRTVIGVELFIRGLPVVTNVGGVVAIGIVLNGTATVIADVFHFAGHLQLHTEAEQVGYLRGLIGSHLLNNLDSSPAVDGVGKGKGGRYGFHVVFGTNDDCPVCRFMCEGDQL
ncbi:hypothetical protein Barb4_03773 [Bacteroidales bacterium Barb4]|nr:hypothetical protein Barb4_03773 [Bacteroidales bacterium Barb4]